MKRILLPIVVASVAVTFVSQCILIANWFPKCTLAEINALYDTTLAIICLVAVQFLYAGFIYKDKQSEFLSMIPKHIQRLGHVVLSLSICLLLNHSFYGLVIFKDLLQAACNTDTFDSQYPLTQTCVLLSYIMYIVSILVGHLMKKADKVSQFKKARFKAEENFLDLRTFQ